MLLMMIMLGVALLPAGDVLWQLMPGLPALCFFKRLVSRTPDNKIEFSVWSTPSMSTSLMVLFLSYLTRLIKLSRRSTAFVRLWIRHKPGRFFRSMIELSKSRSIGIRASDLWRLNHLVFETLYILSRAIFDIYESALWEVRHNEDLRCDLR